MSGSVAAENFGKVAVLMGGRAAEREVSLKSGQAVLQALRSRGVDAHRVDPAATALEVLRAGGYDRAFIALHGCGGEDGVIQGALETIGLPYTGSGVLASALGMDKRRCKLLWQGAGLPTPAFRVVASEQQLAEACQVLDFPLMVKPAREGSSIGITKLIAPEDLTAAWRAAEAQGCEVIAEQFIQGAEYTAAILGDEALPLIRLETPRTFYDYEAKYRTDTTRYICPCGLSRADEAALQDLALAAFQAIDARGWGRVDFMCDGAGRPWLLEVNTVPGMTDHSLVPMAARARGIDFAELVLRILQETLPQ